MSRRPRGASKHIPGEDRVRLFEACRFYVQNITVSFVMFDAKLEVLFFGDRPHSHSCPFSRQHCHALPHIQCFRALMQFHTCSHYDDGNFQYVNWKSRYSTRKKTFRKPRNIAIQLSSLYGSKNQN